MLSVPPTARHAEIDAALMIRFASFGSETPRDLQPEPRQTSIAAFYCPPSNRLLPAAPQSTIPRMPRSGKRIQTHFAGLHLRGWRSFEFSPSWPLCGAPTALRCTLTGIALALGFAATDPQSGPLFPWVRVHSFLSGPSFTSSRHPRNPCTGQSSMRSDLFAPEPVIPPASMSPNSSASLRRTPISTA